jgi:hypothetical protein
MTETVTLQLPNDLASTAYAVAQQTRRPLEEVLVDWLAQAAETLPVELLTDQQVLDLTQLEIAGEHQELLSQLLGKHREGQLGQMEQRQLDQLMQLYRHGLIRKAEAFRVAVERELLPPLN